MTAYYNEIDPYAAQWLRNLIAAGHIAPGDVDERSILEVKPDDLRSYTQCHFFAGIGGWSHALRLAGWPDDRPVWTGSCPCQPFSAAGKQRGSDDERHLWPAFFDLIRKCGPGRVFGEQVAGAAGLAWLDHVCADLEGAGYAAAAADLPACSVGAPHRRQRLYWVAKSNEGQRRQGRATPGRARGAQPEFAGPGVVRALADSNQAGRGEQRQHWLRENGHAHARSDADGCGADDGVAYTKLPERRPLNEYREDGRDRANIGREEAHCIARARGEICAWSDLKWIECSDGKARPTQPGIFPLAHGIPNRVGRLRAYGNAIVPQVAAVFVMANVNSATPHAA